jgi:hypothetical protein
MQKGGEQPCSQTNVIEKLQLTEDSKIGVLSFLWQGMNICMVRQTSGADGKRYLSVIVDDAITAAPITGSRMATFIISGADTGRSDAGASTILSGHAAVATEKDTHE